MANNERLTKRVKVMEDWIAENKDIGGPSGTLETFNFLVNEMRALAQQANHVTNQLEQFRAYAFAFIKETDMVSEWDEFIEEKENAVQKQTTEEVPSRDEAEDGEEVGEETPKGKKSSKKSKK